MTTSVNLMRPVYIAAHGNTLTLDVGQGPTSYTLPCAFHVEPISGDKMLLVLPDTMPPPQQQNPAPPPPPPSGSYFIVPIAFTPNSIEVGSFPAEDVLSLQLAVPANAVPGTQGSIRVSEHRTGPMKREGYVARSPGEMSGYHQSGTTLEFRYIIGRPALQWQTRLDPGQTYYVNVRTTRPTEQNCPVVVTAIPPQ